VLASDLDTVMVDSLKALDLIRPIREADIKLPPALVEAEDDRTRKRSLETVVRPGHVKWPRIVRRLSHSSVNSGPHKD
jgi:hypothetical protein